MKVQFLFGILFVVAVSQPTDAHHSHQHHQSMNDDGSIQSYYPQINGHLRPPLRMNGDGPVQSYYPQVNTHLRPPLRMNGDGPVQRYYPQVNSHLQNGLADGHQHLDLFIG